MLIALIALGLAGLANADLVRSSTAQWFWLASIPVGDYLYISGGESYDSIDQPGAASLRRQTLVVDLRTSWTNQTLVAANTSSEPSDMRVVRQPVLFYDETTNLIHRYGGWPYESSEMPSELWSFSAGTLQADWIQNIDPSANGLGSESPGPFAPAAASTGSMFYSFGGNIANLSTLPDMVVLSGLVTLDYSTGTWSNLTTGIPNQNPYRTQAKAVFVPNFGDRGFFVVVGGENPPVQASLYEEGTFMVDMSVITLYDVATNSWYTQTATGDVPPPRSEFCAVGAATSDGTGFEIFVYGGSTNQTYDLSHSDDEGYMNVYALSLPGFRWFKSPSRTAIRRACHTCSVIGNRQMISIGGRLPGSLQPLGVEKDPWVSGIGVFDMTAFTWADIYNPAALAYESPRVVKDYYSSSYEVPQWANERLASIFAFTPLPTVSSPTATGSTTGAPNPTGSTEGAGSPQTGSSSKSSSTGPIVGGVVGGIGAIALLVGLGIWMRRRNRALDNPSYEINEEVKSPPQYPGSAQPNTGNGFFEAPTFKPRQELDSQRPWQERVQFVELPATTRD